MKFKLNQHRVECFYLIFKSIRPLQDNLSNIHYD